MFRREYGVLIGIEAASLGVDTHFLCQELVDRFAMILPSASAPIFVPQLSRCPLSDFDRSQKPSEEEIALGQFREGAVSPRAEFLIKLASLANYWSSNIAPALAQGKLVIVERLFASTLAYCVRRGNFDLDLALEAMLSAFEGQGPHCSFLITSKNPSSAEGAALQESELDLVYEELLLHHGRGLMRLDQRGESLSELLEQLFQCSRALLAQHPYYGKIVAPLKKAQRGDRHFLREEKLAAFHRGGKSVR